MVRFAALGSALTLCTLAVVAALTLGGWGFIVIAVVFGAIALIGIHDLVQRRHSILRNYPILGHMRFAMEAVRPELQQYFIDVSPHHLVRRVNHVNSASYADLYEWLAAGQLVEEPPASWALDWERADPDTFAARAPEPSIA